METIISLVGIVVTVISIVVTVISIIQAYEKDKHEKKQPLPLKFGCFFRNKLLGEPFTSVTPF